MTEIRNLNLVLTGGAAALSTPDFGLRTSDFGRSRGARAFTLIEMLLAVAICAIVLLAINGVFATALRLQDKTSDAVAETLPINRALAILARDLKGTVGPGGFLAGDFKCGVSATGAAMGLSGEAGNAGLDFYTSTGALSDQVPWGDVQEVFYELKAPSDQNRAGMDLVRCVNRNLLATTTPTPEIQKLLSNVQTLQFDCYDGAQWQTSWDTSTGTTNLPVAVRVSIQFVPQPGEGSGNEQPVEMVIPLTSQTRTDLTGGGTQ